MRIFKICLALWFSVVSTQALPALAAERVKEDPQDKIMLNTAVYLTGLKSVGHMVNLMNAMANEEDKKFLSSFTKKELAQPMPEITADVKKRILYIQGKPVQILDMAKRKISFEGREFMFEPDMTAERAIAKLEETIFPKPVAFMDWILPQAYAVSSQNKGMLMGVFGAMGIMGMLACFSGQGQKPAQQPAPQPQQQNQQLAGMGSAGGSCMMGMAGLMGLLMAMGMKADDDVKEVKCTVTADGLRTAQIIGANNRVISSTQGMNGNFMTSPPAVIGPVSYGPQLMQICSNPTALGNINQALARPIVLPPASSMRAYVNPPLQAPAAPGMAVRSLTPQSRKPAETGDARFMDPAGGGAR